LRARRRGGTPGCGGGRPLRRPPRTGRAALRSRHRRLPRRNRRYVRNGAAGRVSVAAQATTSRCRGTKDAPTLADLSHALHDYLREICNLQTDSGRVRTTTLAQRMRVAPPSATAMVKKLAALGLADHQPYRGVRL